MRAGEKEKGKLTESIQEVEELIKKLTPDYGKYEKICLLQEDTTYFPLICFEYPYNNALEMFMFPIYRKTLRFFLDFLKRILRILPILSIGKKSIEGKLIKVKKELGDSGDSYVKKIQSFFNRPFPFFFHYIQTVSGAFFLFFYVSSYYEDDVNLSMPMLRFDVCEHDKLKDTLNEILNFRILNPALFYIDLKHFDPRINIDFSRITSKK